jgi:hypothetical protein
MDWMSGFQFPASAGILFHRNHIQTTSKTKPASYPLCTKDIIPGVKTAGARY